MTKKISWLSKDRILRPLHIAIRGSAYKAVLAVAIFLSLFSSVASANNFAVSNVQLVDLNKAPHAKKIQLDVSWENSWRDATNYDAVRVFAKYCTSDCSSAGTWSHAMLHGGRAARTVE